IRNRRHGAEGRRRLGAVPWGRLVAVDRRGGIRFRHRPGAVPADDYRLVMLRGFQEYCLQPVMGGRPYRTGLPATSRLNLAGGPGFEPGLTESESAVLPLDYPPPRSPQKALKSKDFGMPERSLGPVDILLFEADSPLVRNLIQG